MPRNNDILPRDVEHLSRRPAPRCFARAQAVSAGQYRGDVEIEAIVLALCFALLAATLVVFHLGGSV
jgi:hypothetical protein